MNDDDRSLAAARLIDAKCDEFEQALAAGDSPQIEVVLAKVPDECRHALGVELLGLEIDHRVAQGSIPAVDEYESRFPEIPSEKIKSLINESLNKRGLVPRAASDDSASLQPTLLAPGNTDGTGSDGLKAAQRVVRYFGDYELLREIARGGMGVVYEARQRSLNRPVALKMILAGQFAYDNEIQRFKREAESAAQLDHPNIVPVFETGEYEGQYFFSMGFIDGQSLSHRISQGEFKPREAAALLKTVTDAIAYAHSKKIVHRDLKPGNVLIDKDGTPRITDFGLAKTLDSGSDLTSSGQVMGTPSYMPPEQALGQIDLIGPRSDVYSLGAILYCLLTGKPPFQGDSVVDTLKQVVDREPRSISAVRSGVPIDLVTICSKCLEKKPDSRYESAGELAADLQRFLDGRPIAARPVSRAEHARRWVLRNRVVSSLMALVILVAVSGMIAYSFQRTATDVALGQVAEVQAANQKTSLQSAEIRARAIQGELATLKTTVEPHRHQRALQLIREAAQIRTEVLAKDEWNSPETRPFWDEQETLLRTEAIEWLSRSTLDRLQELNLDARSYADTNSHSWSNSGTNWPAWLAVDPVGNRLAVCRNNQKSGSPVPAHVVELFDLVSGGHIAEFPLDEKSCLFPRPEAIAFSGDGKRLHVVVFSLSPSRERVIQTYTMPDGSLVSSGTVSRDSSPGSQRFRFDTDGKRVLVLGGPNPVLWDLSEHRAITSAALNSALRFSSLSSGILSFTGDGLITTSEGQGLVTRNILTSEVVRELKLPSRYRSPVRSADGRWLVELKAPEGANFNQQGVDLGILNAQSGEEFSKLVGIANNVQVGLFNNVAEFRDPPLLAVSPDKPYAAVLTREELIACELPQGNVIARHKLNPPNADIKKLIGLKFIGSDRLLTVTEVPPGPGQASQAGAMSASNRFQIQTWELSVSQLSPSKTVQIQHAPLDLAVAPAGDILATVGPMNVIRTFTAAGLPHPMAKRPFRGMFGLSPANTMLIEDSMFSQDGVLKSGTQIRSWNLATRQPKTFDPGRSVGYAFNSSEFSSGLPIKWPRTFPLLAVPNGADSGVTILDADSQAMQYTFASPNWSDIRKAEIHPSDRYLMIQSNPPLDSARAGDRSNPSSKSDYSLTVVRHPGGQPVVTIPQLLADPLFGAKHSMFVGVEPAGLTAYDLNSGQRLAQLKHESVAAMPVWGLSYGSNLSPTGKQVVVMTQKASAYQPLLWDLTDGSVSLLDTTWSSQESKQIRWNSDGTRLVLTGRKPGASSLTLEVWNTGQHQKLATSAGRGAAPYSDTPQFIADTELLYLGVSSNNGQTSTGEVWDLTTGETIRKHSRGAIRISANGKFMVLFPESSEPQPAGKVAYQVIETTSGNELHTIADTPLAFSPDGQLLLCAEPLKSAKASLVLWNIASKLRIPLLVEAQLSYSGTGPYAFDPKGRRFAVYDERKIAVQIWDVMSGRIHQTVPLLPYRPIADKPKVEVAGLTFLQDGLHVLAIVNGRPHIINTEAGTAQFVLPRSSHSFQGITGGSTTSVAFNHDASLLATAGTDATVNFWDGKTGDYAGMLESFGGAVTSVRFHPTENQAITRDATGNLTLWGLDIDADHSTDPAQPRVIWNRSISSPEVQQRGATVSRAAQLAVSRGPSPKIAVPMDSGEVQIIDLQAGDVTKSIAGTGQITGLAFHHQQPLLAIAYASKLVRLINHESGATMREWDVSEFPLNGVVFSNDGKHVVTIGRDVVFWNLTTGQKDLEKQLPSSPLNTVAVNPATGALIVTAGDQTLTLWNPYTIKDQLNALGLRWD